MSSKRFFSRSVGLLSAGMLAMGIVACSENDDGSPPEGPDYCIVEWQGAGSSGFYHVYRLVMTAEAWQGPTASFTSDLETSPVFAVGAFNLALNAPSIRQAEFLTTATAGTFSVSSGGAEEGASVTFEDTSANPYLTVGTDLATIGQFVGNAGVGSFTGVWSNLEALDVGTGAITIVSSTAGDTLSLADAAFGWCEDFPESPSFAPASLREIGLDVPARRR